ncbi:hypothetical protein HN958_03455 [Candidatus Falkowbacteria bacterium]|jgi:hypothetical protein|nr:hypothetical protein [Candidatus Falkowbacteria bacterium]
MAKNRTRKLRQKAARRNRLNDLKQQAKSRKEWVKGLRTAKHAANVKKKAMAEERKAEERQRQAQAEEQSRFELEREQEAWADENVYVTSPTAKYFYLRTDPRVKRISPKNRIEGTIPQLVASYGDRDIAA